MPDDIEAIAKRHGIRLVLQFGSSVTGKDHARSDVDIAVLLEQPRVSSAQFAELLHELQRHFPHRDVDLAIINHADPLFLKKITDHCEILHGSVQELHRLKIYAFKRYQDHRRYFGMEREFVDQFLADRRRA